MPRVKKKSRLITAPKSTRQGAKGEKTGCRGAFCANGAASDATGVAEEIFEEGQARRRSNHVQGGNNTKSINGDTDGKVTGDRFVERLPVDGPRCCLGEGDFNGAVVAKTVLPHGLRRLGDAAREEDR